MAINFGAKILNNAISGLNAQQAVIANVGNNIANVNTPGFTRRDVELQTRAGARETSGISVGNGVEITGVKRYSDLFLEKILRGAIADNEQYKVQDEILNRAEALFDLAGNGSTVGNTLTAFFTAVNDLSTDPSSTELRTNILERAQDLVTALKTTYNETAKLQAELDLRIATDLEVVNSITGQIAELNGAITSIEAAGNKTAVDERDQRDILLKDLAGKLSFEMLENPNGSVNLSLSNGFALVYGSTSRDLEISKSPSFTAGNVPPGLDGTALGYIVYNYDKEGGAAHIDLTNLIAQEGGSLGGMLKLRGTHQTGDTSPFEAQGVLPEIGARIESISRMLLTTLNATYRGPGPAAGIAGSTDLAGDLDGNPPDVFGLFKFAGAVDSEGNGIPTDVDLAASGHSAFTPLLELTFTDPRRFAAAWDVNRGVGVASYPQGDGQNLTALADLQNDSFTFTAGSFSRTGTVEEIYHETVTYVSNARSRARLNATTASDYYVTAANQRDQFSGVNLDEEFANLIRFQQAYQASARMIGNAQKMFDTLMQML